MFAHLQSVQTVYLYTLSLTFASDDQFGWTEKLKLSAYSYECWIGNQFPLRHVKSPLLPLQQASITEKDNGQDIAQR